MKIKYTKDNLEPIVKECRSYNQVLLATGRKLSGGNSSHLKRRLKDFDIDIGHFSGQSWNINGIPANKKSAEDILILRESGGRAKTYQLRRALIEVGRSYTCDGCGLGNTWNGKKIALQIDHINANWLDDRACNLRFLCPNCHAQTETFCVGAVAFEVVSSNVCIECLTNIVFTSGNICKSCTSKKQKRKVDNRPSRDIILAEVNQLGYSATGRKYGVSDNAIRKWLK